MKNVFTLKNTYTSPKAILKRPKNFQPWSDDEGEILLVIFYPPNIYASPAEGCLTLVASKVKKATMQAGYFVLLLKFPTKPSGRQLIIEGGTHSRLMSGGVGFRTR
ncbi:hypothetical protein AVEN_56758-1 [Araneus ventricosus]|uniref:Uncharacterized protein n=1 Tax=Araneus ventricosus TaxID=182803 RepID=A0A4Y2EV90_ARAVE|nr:hypothetical protein AVEN_56758-1 [Araneus ventricosus]